jgi:carbonic anhydrase
LQKFLDGYHTFRATYFAQHKEMLQRLMAKGQSPEALMIACSDSRIDPSLEFGAGPGDLFMVRNVAAIVPPYEPDDRSHGTSAALEFGVVILNVKHVTVLGHAMCGGIRALVRHEETAATDFVTSWMKIAAAARDRALAIAGKVSEDELQRLCEQEAVKESLKNLLTFPWIKERVLAGTLELHGWHFDLGTGTLQILDKTGVFKTA